MLSKNRGSHGRSTCAINGSQNVMLRGPILLKRDMYAMHTYIFSLHARTYTHSHTHSRHRYTLHIITHVLLRKHTHAHTHPHTHIHTHMIAVMVAVAFAIVVGQRVFSSSSSSYLYAAIERSNTKVCDAKQK